MVFVQVLGRTLAVAEGAVDVALGFLFLEFFPLVLDVLSLGQGQLDLDPASLEIKLYRNKGEPFLVDPGRKPGDLVAVQKQFSDPGGVGIVTVALFVRGDVHPVEEHFLLFHARETVLEVGFAVADGFHLAPGQRDAGLDAFQDKIIMEGLAILEGGGPLRHNPSPRSGAGTPYPRFGPEPLTGRPTGFWSRFFPSRPSKGRPTGRRRRGDF